MPSPAVEGRAAAVIFPDNPAALALARELGVARVPVVLVSGGGVGPGRWSRFVRAVPSPPFHEDAPGFVAFLREHAPAWSAEPPVLFPTTDAAVLVMAAFEESLRTSFRLPFPAAVARAILDKRRFLSRAAAAGAAVPVTVPADEASIDGFARAPCLVKPPCRYRLDGSGAVVALRAHIGPRKVLVGDPRRSVEALHAAGFLALLQEEIPGGTDCLWSVGLCLGRGGELCGHIVVRKRVQHPDPFGDGVVVDTVPDPGALAETARRVLAAMGYWGLADVEFKHDPREGTFKLLEANPRPWLWLDLGRRAGVPLGTMAYALACGAPVPNATPRTGVRWASPRGVLAFLWEDFRPRRHGIALPPWLLLAAAGHLCYQWRVYRDPVRLRPAAWRALVAEIGSRRRRRTEAAQPGGVGVGR